VTIEQLILSSISTNSPLNVTESTTENATESSTGSTGAVNQTCGAGLVEGLEEICEAPELDEEDKQDLKECVEEIKVVLQCGCSEELKIKLVGKKLKKVCKKNKKLCKKIRFKKVKEFGYVCEVEQESNIRQMRYTDVIITKNGSRCPLIDALQNSSDSSSDSNYQASVSELIFQCEYVINLPESDGWSNNQKKGAISVIIKNHNKKHPEHEEKIKACKINFPESGEEYGDVDILLSACEKFEQFTTAKEIVGGPATECPLVKAMDACINISNTNYTLVEKKEIKQLRDKFVGYFNVEVSIELRVAYVDQECEKLFAIASWIKIVVLSIEITKSDGSKWGDVMDLKFTAVANENYGCGNLTAGPGQLPSCAYSLNTIAVNETTNSTLFEDSIEKVVATWSIIEKTRYSSLRNSIKTCIRSTDKTICEQKGPNKCRTKCIKKSVDTYCTTPALAAQRQKFLSIKVKTWYSELDFVQTSTVEKFCDCASQP
jgi:hypothetical protein